MIKSLLTTLVVIPLAVVLVALAVANRRNVTLALDPFSPETPAFAVTMPLFMIIFGAVTIGVILGGVAVWMKQGRHRRAAREQRFEATRWRSMAEQERERAETLAGPATDAPALPAPRRKRAA